MKYIIAKNIRNMNVPVCVNARVKTMIPVTRRFLIAIFCIDKKTIAIKKIVVNRLVEKFSIIIAISMPPRW